MAPGLDEFDVLLEVVLSLVRVQVAVMEVVSKKIFSFSRNRHLTLR